MDSNKQEKQLAMPKAEKVAKTRRNFLRVTALGAAVIAAGVLTGAHVNAATDQPGTRSVGKVKAQKTVHTTASGRSARKLGTFKSAGAPKEAGAMQGGQRTLQPKASAAKATMKVAKSAEKSQMGARQTAKSATQKAMKGMKTPG